MEEQAEELITMLEVQSQIIQTISMQLQTVEVQSQVQMINLSRKSNKKI